MINEIEAYISLLIQIPLVGIFVWFALTLIKGFQQSLEKRDEQWRAFLKEQSEANHLSIVAMASRFGDEIQNLSKGLSEMRGELTRNGRTKRQS